jgi:hypothetical protein
MSHRIKEKCDKVMRIVITPDARTNYLDSAVLDTGDLLTFTHRGHHGAQHLVAGQGPQVEDPICAPCHYVEGHNEILVKMKLEFCLRCIWK